AQRREPLLRGFRGALAAPERASFRLLRDGGGSGRSRGGPRDHHRRLSHTRDPQRRSGESAETMTPSLHLWLIPALPLIGAAINGFFGRRFSRQTVAAIALAFCGGAFAWVLYVCGHFSHLTLPHNEILAPWIRSGDFLVNFEFYLDQLTLVMLLVV